MSDLATLSSFLAVFNRWEEAGTPIADLLKDVLEVARDVIPQTKSLHAHRVRGDYLLSFASERQSPEDRSLHADEQSEAQREALTAVAPINREDGRQWYYAPERAGRRVLLVQLQLDATPEDTATVSDWLTLIGDQLAIAIQHRAMTQLLQRQAIVTSRLTEVATFTDIAQAIAGDLLAKGQFVTINLLRYNTSGDLIGLRTIAAANRRAAFEVNVEIPLSIDVLDEKLTNLIVNGQTIAYDDLQSATHVNDQLKFTHDGEPIISIACFPMRVQGRVLGVVVWNDLHAPLDITADETELLQSIADQAGSVIVLRELTEETALSQRISERQSLIFNELVAGLDYSDMAQVLMRHLLDAGKLLSIGELIYDNYKVIGWEVKAVATPERLLEWRDDETLRWQDLSPTLQAAIYDNEIYSISDASQADAQTVGAEFMRWLTHHEAGSYLCIPVATGQQPIAIMIAISRRKYAFSREEINAYRNISELMGSLLNTARLSQTTAATREMIDNLVLANRLITTAGNYAYMAQAILYTLGRDISGAGITLFDRAITAEEEPASHVLVGFSAGSQVVQPDTPPRIGRPSADQIRRLHAGSPVTPNPDDLNKILPANLYESMNLPPQDWFVVFGLRSGDHLIGTLTLANDTQLPLNDDTISAYTTLADQIGLVIRGRQLLDESKSLQTVATRLIQAQEAINRAGDYDEIGQIMMTILPDEINGVAIVLFSKPVTPESPPKSMTLQAYIPREGEATYPAITDAGDPDHERWRAIADVLLSGETWKREEAHAENISNPNAARYLIGQGVASFITLGLRAGTRLIGFLTLTKEAGFSLSADQLANVRAIADQTAITLENRRLLEQTAESLLETQTLYAVNRALINAQEEADILRIVYEQMASAADQVMIARVLYHVGIAHDVVITATYDGSVRELSHSVLETAGEQAVEDFLLAYTSRTARFITDVTAEPELAPILAVADAGQIRTMIIVATHDENRVARLLMIAYNREQYIDERTRRLFNALGDQVEIVLENQRLIAGMQSAAAKLGRQVIALQTINNVSGIIASTLDQQSLFDNTCEALYSALNVAHVGIGLYDISHNELQVVSEYPGEGSIGSRIDMSDPVQMRLRTEKRHIVINDVSEELELSSDTRQILQSIGVNAILLLPLLDTDKEFIGSIGLDLRGQQATISQEMIDIAQTITSQVVVSLRNIRLLEASRRQADRMEQIASFSRALQASLRVEELLSVGIDSLRQVVQSDYSGIALYDGNSGRPRRVAWQEGTSRIIVSVTGGPFIDIPNTTSDVVWRKQDTLIINDHSASNAPAFAGSPKVASSLSMPIFSRGVLRGLIELGSNLPNAYNMTDRFIAQQLVNQLAVAIENAEVYQQSQRLAQSKALVNEISSKLQQQTNMEQLLSVTMNELGQALGARRGRIYLSPDALLDDDERNNGS